MAIDPLTAAFNSQMAQLMAAGPPRESLTAEQLREFTRAAAFAVPANVAGAHDRSVAGPAGEIPVRVVIPDNPLGVLLYLHGGGWVIGGHDFQDAHIWSRAQAASVAVVAAGYRLAPEHPYPAAQDDCEAVAAWLTEHAQAEFGTDKLLIAGESAGGHLAAATLLRMRDRHGYTGFRGAALNYGAYDLRLTPSVRSFKGHPIITGEMIDWFVGQYVPAALRETPDVSPLLAGLGNMPPALFTVGTLDPLLDDTLFMAARWKAAGNATDLRVYEGGLHGFDLFPTPTGIEAAAIINAFLARCLAG